MNRKSILSSITWGGLFTRVMLVVISVVIIVFFLPRNSGTQFRYDTGKPWMYGSLIANFDFTVYKTDEAMKAEKDSVISRFEPYYNYSSDVADLQIARFINLCREGQLDVSSECMKVLEANLREVYSVGIMNTAEYSKMFKDTLHMVRIVKGRNATTVGMNQVYSGMEAYSHLISDERVAPYKAALQKYNINEYIVPNLSYDKERSEAELDDIIEHLPAGTGVVMAGQKIIDRGEIVDEYIYRVLNSLEREMIRRSAYSSQISSTVAGQALFVTILIVLFTLYLGLFRKDYFEKPRSILMLYVLITVFPVLVSLMMVNSILSVYVLPLAIVPIFIRVFMDSRTAFISHVTMVLICAAAVKYQYEFIIVQLVAGLVAIYSLRELSQRAQLFKTAILVTVASCAIYFGLQLMQDNSIFDMDHSLYKHILVNGVLLLFAYPLMLIVEKAFGFISSVTLIELSNTSKDPLRKLSEVAPGTFQHSIMVSNLAAEIANKIGAKTQLVRTGAMYHDIGKLYNPAFFTENQAGVNPLSNMERTEAAQIVLNHVSDGLKLAERYNLPNVIKDFISTHHGTGKTKFFYISYMNEHPGEEVDESKFTYKGPDPFTREQAILMMADGVEAASRSLPEYTEESISNMVNRLVDGQVSDGYFNHCPITFRDIAVAKLVLIERLKTIYHTRISYPELKR